MRNLFYSLLLINLFGCTLLITRPGSLECDASSPARCDGNSLVVCFDGVEFSQDCGEATCQDGVCDAGEAICGNNNIEAGEQCEDANVITTDSCINCQNARCGDGFLRSGVEQCDDGDNQSGDGCSANCIIENAGCGNGQVNAGEQCDDANNISTDACVSCQNARCGDGFVRSGVEQCDDGDTTSGDGCSSTCQTEGSAAGTCQTPTTASLGSQSGTTVGQQSVLQSTCTGANAPEVVFRFTPSTSGTLDITLQSPLTDQGFYVRSSCQTPTDIVCVDAVGSGDEVGAVSVTAGVPIFIIVDGFNSAAQAGPFTLLLSQGGGFCGNGTINAGEQCDDANTITTDACIDCQSAVCGDGFVRSGFEQCDDGDNQSGDGCSSTCQTEGGAAGTCASPIIAQAGTNTGDTTGKASITNPSCQTAGASGGDVAFRFTAAASGTLNFQMVSSNDMGIILYTGCGVTELLCADVDFVQVAGDTETETASLSVTAGQTIFIFVGAFAVGNEGPFTLTIQ